MTEYKLGAHVTADKVETIDMCLETFHRYRQEYIKRHGDRPQIDDTFTPQEGGITYTNEDK